MNIFYYSVHQILEDDEVRLFKTLGHNVFCLGANSRDGAIQGFRPPINFSDHEKSLYDEFAALGGKFTFGNVETIEIPESFVDKFDVFVVMHDVAFILKFWHLIYEKVVVWRTIGQGVEAFEERLKPYRDAGLMIVRYSPVETGFANCIGQDAVIRFYKSSDRYSGWHGSDASVLTFSNIFAQRYADDYNDYTKIIDGIPSYLGGIGNEAASNAIGLVDAEEQLRLLQASRVYLYASGLYIPYTLNFMEAWMTGIPVVVHAPYERRDQYFEIDSLVVDGENGFVCRDVATARSRIKSLLNDFDLATNIGAAGRRAAIHHFGEKIITEKWKDLLESIFHRHKNRPVPIAAPEKKVSNVKHMSIEVFETLRLLTPYDINVEKVRFGNPRDGGYVLADLGANFDVVSFGVGPDVTFEYEMAERGHEVFLHDHTVEETPQTHSRFHFSKMGICGAGGETDELLTLEHHLDRIGSQNAPLVLKMDVEGFEWDVFSTVDISVLERFQQITLEIHWLENLSNKQYRSKVYEALSKINKLFTLFHVHANNCAELHIIEGFTVASVLELSYVRSSTVQRSYSSEVYPSALDLANHPSFHDHALLFFPFLPTSVSSSQIGAAVKRIDLEKQHSASG